MLVAAKEVIQEIAKEAALPDPYWFNCHSPKKNLKTHPETNRYTSQGIKT